MKTNSKFPFILAAALTGSGILVLLSCAQDQPPAPGPTTEVVRCPSGSATVSSDLLAATCADTLDLSTSAPQTRAALVRNLRWKKDVLQVRFMNGDTQTQTRVQAAAKEWSNYCRMRFDFGDHHPADVRISFTCGGHWSRIGTGTGDLSDNQPTMNLTLNRGTSTTEVRRVTLHEFGHALGLIHEHQSPGVTIQWNEPKVIEYYRATQGWDEAKTRRNVLIPYSSGTVTNSQFDAHSIMLYPIPRELTRDGFHTDWNTSLSSQDIGFIGAIYPKS